MTFKKWKQPSSMSSIHQGSAFLSLTISTDERICTIYNYFPLIIASQHYYTPSVVTPVWVNIKTSIRGNGYQEFMTWNFIDIKWHATTAFEDLIWFFFFFDPNVLCQKSYTQSCHQKIRVTFLYSNTGQY